MAKVTWPTREELRGSTIVVIVAVIIMAVFIGSVDWGLSRLLQLLIQ
jgi:preprotein translocase subunit SecE